MPRREHTHTLSHSCFFGSWYENYRTRLLCEATGGNSLPMRSFAQYDSTTTALGFKMILTRMLNELRRANPNSEPSVYEIKHQRPNQNDRLVCVVSHTRDDVTYSDLFVLAAKDGVS